MARHAATSGCVSGDRTASTVAGVVAGLDACPGASASVALSGQCPVRKPFRHLRETRDRGPSHETIPGAICWAVIRRAKRLAAGGKSTSRRPADEARNRERSARVRRCSAGPGDGSSTPSARREPGGARRGASGSPDFPSKAHPGTGAAVRREMVGAAAWPTARDPGAVRALPSSTRELAACPQARGRRTWRGPATAQSRSLRGASAALRG